MKTAPTWPRAPTWLALFVLGLSIYLLTLPADLRNNGDTTYRFDVTQAMVQKGNVELTCSRPPPDSRVVRGRHGCYYTIYAPGQSVLMLPLYGVGNLVSDTTHLSTDFSEAIFVRALDPILGALVLVVFFLLALEIGYTLRTAIVLTLILGFASTLWPDVQSGQEHTQVSLFLMVSVYATVRAFKARPEPTVHLGLGSSSQRGPFSRLDEQHWLMIAGLASGLGIFTRYDFIIYAVVLVAFIGLLAVLEGRRIDGKSSVYGGISRSKIQAAVSALTSFFLGFLPFVLLDGLWNTARFGAPWRLGQSATSQLGFPIWQGIPSLLFSPAKGLIWYAPFVWLLPLAVRGFTRRAPALTWVSAPSVAVAVIFYANLIYWQADPAWGPRYLFPVVPLLVLPLGFLLENISSFRMSTRTVIVGVIGLSLAVQLASISVDPWRFWYHLIQQRQQAAQVFRWDPRTYNYYWSRNPGLDPELYQFVAVRDVIRVGLGQTAAAIPATSSETGTCSAHLPVRRFDACQLKGVAKRPLNTISPIWLNDRYQWFNPAAVPLPIGVRIAVVGIFLLCAGLSGAALLLQLSGHEGKDHSLPA